jgi:uncharacterized membrane protein YfcA
MDAPLLQVLIGAAVAGFVQGLSGFAFGLAAMGIWAWSVSPQLAGPMVVFGSLIGQLLSIHSVRADIDLRRVLPFILGGVIGVPLGAAALPHLNPTLFKAGVGLLLAVYCPVMLLTRELPRIRGGGRVADGVAGLAGGIMGGVGGLSGPAPTLWCTLRHWSGGAQRAVIQSFNLAMHALTLTVYIVDGAITAETGRMFAVIAPTLVVPCLIGARLYSRVSEIQFRRLVLALLFLSGLGLLASSGSHLLGHG